MKFQHLSKCVCLFILAQAFATAQKPQLTPYEDRTRYRLQAGDVIEIQYRFTPEYNQIVTIQPDAFVSLLVIGDLKVGNLTLEQAKAAILGKASATLNEPEVTLILKEFQKPYFVVSGEVATPGKFEMRENVTAMQAVMLAGGFKETARASQIVVFRKINTETAEVKVLNLKGIKKTSDLEQDIALQSGDMLLVPQNTITRIERYMKLANVGLFINPLSLVHP